MKEVSSQNFEQIRTQLEESESITKRIPISAISVDDECMKRGQILIQHK